VGAVQERRRRTLVLAGLVALLLVAAGLALGIGALAIPLERQLAILLAELGLWAPPEDAVAETAVLLSIRLPRAILGIAVGAGLAVAGAALQGLFRNPLADPGLISVSNGAALAAVTVIVFGGAAVSGAAAAWRPYLLPAAAFGGGLAVTLFLQLLARREGATDIAVLLLAGIAINAITAAGMGVMIFAADDQQLRDLSLWTLGSLSGKPWSQILPALPLIALAVGGILAMGRPLNAFLLGEGEAFHLGYDVEAVKRRLVLCVAMAAGAAVAVSGVIGFLGLVVPHLVRLLLGPDHRLLLPASALLGAALLLFADLGARLLVLPAELPIGILTALIGGPFFLWLLARRRSLHA